MRRRYGVNPKTVAKWKARPPFPTCRQNPAAQIDSPCQPRKRPSLLPSKAYFAAARRLPLCPAADDPPSDALISSPVSATPRRSPGCRRSKAKPSPERNSRPIRSAISYRHRRGSNRPRQTPPARRHRPNVEVRLRRVAREGGAPTAETSCARLIAAVPYQGPYRPHRRWSPLHHARQYELGGPDIKAALEAGEARLAHAFEYACARTTSITG